MTWKNLHRVCFIPHPGTLIPFAIACVKFLIWAKRVSGTRPSSFLKKKELDSRGARRQTRSTRGSNSEERGWRASPGNWRRICESNGASQGRPSFRLSKLDLARLPPCRIPCCNLNLCRFKFGTRFDPIPMITNRQGWFLESTCSSRPSILRRETAKGMIDVNILIHSSIKSNRSS